MLCLLPLLLLQMINGAAISIVSVHAHNLTGYVLSSLIKLKLDVDVSHQCTQSD